MPAATRIGGHAARVLSFGIRDGRVASTFRHGALLRFGGRSGPILISLQAPEAAFHPWAVEVEGVPGAPGGTSVAVGQERIRWNDGTAIDLIGAPVDSLEIGPCTAEQARVASTRSPLLATFAGGRKERGSEDPLEIPILGILDAWAMSGDASKLSKLIGLGDGSTPAGDDVLVGVLAGLHLGFRSSPPRERDRLEETLRSGLDRTTLGSAQMLEAALDGAFPEPLRRLVYALREPGIDNERILARIQDVMRLGASSGRSMLLGLSRTLLPN